MKKWQSNAEWSDFPKTTDTHNTRESAQAVCNILLEDYTEFTPCETRGECVHAWVSEIEEE